MRYKVLIYALPLLFVACNQSGQPNAVLDPGPRIGRIYSTEYSEELTTKYYFDGDSIYTNGYLHFVESKNISTPSLSTMRLIVNCKPHRLDGSTCHLLQAQHCDNQEINSSIPVLYPGVPSLAQATKLSNISTKYDSTDTFIYWHAGLEKIVITANKILFGREPGQDLTDKFEVITPLTPFFTFKWDSYDMLYDHSKECPTRITDYYGTLLSYYHLILADTPEEQYKDICFDISLTFQMEDNKRKTVSNSVTVEFEN